MSARGRTPSGLIEILRLFTVIFFAGLGYETTRFFNDRGHANVLGPFNGVAIAIIVGSGIGYVVGQAGLDKVFEVLRAPAVEEPTNWSRRYKANLEKLASGDINKVGEVVRDLWRRDRERGLSAGEKRMLSKARQILVSELALAEGTNEDKAEAILDEVLAS